jgi:hypothetical protein
MNETRRPSFSTTALSIAGAMGCFMVVFILATLALGLAIDQVLDNQRRFVTLGCVIVGLPINLLITLRLTQYLIRRALPKSANVSDGGPLNSSPSQQGFAGYTEEGGPDTK